MPITVTPKEREVITDAIQNYIITISQSRAVNIPVIELIISLALGEIIGGDFIKARLQETITIFQNDKNSIPILAQASDKQLSDNIDAATTAITAVDAVKPGPLDPPVDPGPVVITS